MPSFSAVTAFQSALPEASPNSLEEVVSFRRSKRLKLTSAKSEALRPKMEDVRSAQSVCVLTAQKSSSRSYGTFVAATLSSTAARTVNMLLRWSRTEPVRPM